MGNIHCLRGVSTYMGYLEEAGQPPISDENVLFFWIYALLSRNFVVEIYAIFSQIFWDWKSESANSLAFRMFAHFIFFPNTILFCTIPHYAALQNTILHQVMWLLHHLCYIPLKSVQTCLFNWTKILPFKFWFKLSGWIRIFHIVLGGFRISVGL